MDRPKSDVRVAEVRALLERGALDEAYSRLVTLTDGPLRDDPEALVLYGRVASLLHFNEDAIRALDRVPALGDPVQTAWSLVWRGQATNNLGRFRDATEDVREGLRRAREIDDIDLLLSALMTASSTVHRMGAVELALEYIEEAMVLARAGGRERDQARIAVIAAPALISAGRVVEAVEQLEWGFEWALEHGQHDLARRLGNKLALTELRAGRLDEALELLGRIQMVPGGLAGVARVEWLAVRCDIDRMRGHEPGVGLRTLRGLCALDAERAYLDAEWALSSSDPESAEVHIRTLEDAAHPGFLAIEQGATTLRAVLEAERGNWERVEHLLSAPHLRLVTAEIDLQAWLDHVGELADSAGQAGIRTLAWSLAYPFYALHGNPRAQAILDAMKEHRGPFPLGAFDISGLMRSGGMGLVFEGIHRRSGAPVVLKVLRPPERDRAAILQLFEREIRRMTELNHVGVLPAYDHGVIGPCLAVARGFEQGSPFVVLPRLEGDLTAFAGKLGWSQLRGVLLQVLDALADAHAHQQVHLDVKADNVLYRRTNRGLQVWLADFGLAVTYAELRSRRAGTPNNMAPEQWVGNPTAIGPWTDLYALGCTAWLLITGEPPFDGTIEELERAHCKGPRPRLDRDDLPAGLDDWLQRMMAVQLPDRFHRAQDAKDALLALGGGGWGTTHQPIPRSVVEAGLSLVPHRRAPIEGRDAERARLWQALGEARHGPVQLDLVGRGGSGCTALARWIGETHHRHGGQFWDVHVGALGVVHALRDVMRRVVVRKGRGREEVERVARAFRLPAPSQIAAVASSQLPPQESFEAFWTIASEAARWRPLVVLLDETDEPLNLPDAPLLVLRTRRSGGGLRIGRLGDAEVARSLSALAPLQAETAHRIARLARGNPGHAHQLLLLCIEQRLLTSSSSGYVLRESWASTLPTTYESALEARIRQLVGTTNLELVAQLATLGRAVPRSAWTTTFPHLEEQVWPVLERAGLAVELPGVRVWRHRDLYAFLRELGSR